MFRVLLVDDEPFIVQGLKVLIDWEEEGYEIVKTAANGMEALSYLKEQQVDLIVADIKMPVMSGLELLEVIRKEKISDAYFIILSGFSDFNFAQQAIRNDCFDYILKPVVKEELLRVLHRLNYQSQGSKTQKQNTQKMEKAYLARNMISLIFGKYDQINLDYIREHMRWSEGISYVDIEIDNIGQMEELMDEEKRNQQRKLYAACLEFLKEDGDHCIFDVTSHEKSYDIGFIYCDYMAKEKKQTQKEYLEAFRDYLYEAMNLPVVMLVGKKVGDISKISNSYGAARILRSFQAFRKKRRIYFYEKEVQVNNNGIVLCKQYLDDLLLAVEQNAKGRIGECVEKLFEEMNHMRFTMDTVNLNINYLLFQLIHLASEQDSYVNQEEIMRFISENSFEGEMLRGGKEHLTRLSCEYAAYLEQLRKHLSKDILYEVEKDIRKNYGKNLTLREYSNKYYLNSAYLGQLFRKKYGMSFKDYLNNCRIEQAAVRLLRTDDKIYQIAEEVGYHDLDYFVNRFISVKGCTPSKFRKGARH
ncbi:response regulator transcription factor [Lacrimispora sp.]|uniref:response regulator transcription factor n=1 Tax=Lacrimispora sp. TaxID=2719234 RepID=UPI0028A7ECCA|nr:response regulator [Lacrimispora sp.]